MLLDVERISFSIFEWVKIILSGLSASGNKVWNFCVAGHAEKNEKKNFCAFLLGLVHLLIYNSYGILEQWKSMRNSSLFTF